MSDKPKVKLVKVRLRRSYYTFAAPSEILPAFTGFKPHLVYVLFPKYRVTQRIWTYMDSQVEVL